MDSPVFLITGASTGIGAATARVAVDAGYRVVLAARSADTHDPRDDRGRARQPGPPDPDQLGGRPPRAARLALQRHQHAVTAMGEALRLEADVDVNEILIRPTAQSG